MNAQPKPIITVKLTANRVAALLDKSVRWVKDKVKAGEFVGYRVDGQIMVEASSVNEYFDKCRIGTE